jgi:hypothetical protein
VLTISGTVLLPSGAPARGVDLMLTPPTIGVNVQIKSDEDGRYAFDWRPPITPFGARAGVRVYTLIARDLANNFATAHTFDEKTTNLDLHLQPGLTISAKVVDPDGKPITDATGTLSIFYSANLLLNINRPPIINADDQGRVQFKALPQGYRYSVSFKAPDHGASSGLVIRKEETQSDRLDLPAMVLKVAKLKLAGQVLGLDGKGAGGVTVGVAGVGQPTTSTVTDDSGHFSLNVCEGTVNVSAVVRAVPGGRIGATGGAQSTGGDTNVQIKLMLRAPAQLQDVPQVL